MWGDVIICGCETLYSVSDVKHIVSAKQYIQSVWYHGNSGCKKEVQWLWLYKYSEYVIVYNEYDVKI